MKISYCSHILWANRLILFGAAFISSLIADAGIGDAQARIACISKAMVTAFGGA